jgi:DNA-binding transcriptional LysR family regulator
VELRHLRYFIVVAESGGFARAATHFHVTQPALSRQVQDLEEELQVALLNRSKRGVILTAAGKAFLEDSHQILLYLERARVRAQRTQSGKMGTLTIGLVDSFSWQKIITRSIRAFCKDNPDVALSVDVMQSRAQLAALREGRLSGGFLFRRPAAEKKDLETVKLLSDRIMVAVSDASPLAQHPPKRLAGFTGETLFCIPRRLNPLYYDEIIQTCRQAELEANIVEGGMNDTANLALVAAGLGCAFVPSEIRRRKPQEVVLLPINDLEVYLTLEFAWHRENCDPALKNFVRSVKTSTHTL